jgi:hypothetical protein
MHLLLRNTPQAYCGDSKSKAIGLLFFPKKLRLFIQMIKAAHGM